MDRDEDRTVYVRPKRVLDRDTVPELRKRLVRLARKSGMSDMVVDLSGVATVDTAGLAMLVELHILLSHRGRRLRLHGANEQVDRMVRLACLDQFFQAHGTSEGGA